jgi:hypothetical protein
MVVTGDNRMLSWPADLDFITLFQDEFRYYHDLIVCDLNKIPQVFKTCAV